MKKFDPRQLELFSDGAKRPKPPRPTEADLQARLDAARQRLHEIVILRMKTWIREETRRGLREAEDWRRERVRFHFEGTISRGAGPRGTLRCEAMRSGVDAVARAATPRSAPAYRCQPTSHCPANITLPRLFGGAFSCRDRLPAHVGDLQPGH
jgi:hypothetical protein